MTGSDADYESANPHGRTCEMPECDGTGEEFVACRDPSGELLEMCDSCLDEGWRAVVEVLDG